MIRGRFAYAVTLLCGGAFYLFYPGYLSFYTLVLLLCLPPLSLLLALPRRRKVALGVTADRVGLVRGETGALRLSIQGAGGQSVRLTYRLENLLFPSLSREEALTLREDAPAALALPTDHCGWLRFAPLRCQMQDWLGLFALSVPLPEATLVLVTPQEGVLPRELDLSPQAGRPLRPRPGGGPGEDYELRPYRPGDAVKSIHWKLTAKLPGEEPILRETMEPQEERLVVYYDHFGPPEDLDRVLDQLWGLAQYCLDKESTFTLCWTNPDSGAVGWYDVDCPKAWERCYRDLAAKPAPLSGQRAAEKRTAPPGWAGSVKWLYLTAHGGEGAAEP